MNDLTISQSFFLLASDSTTHRWRTPMRNYLETYVAGSVLVELLLQEKIRLNDSGKLEAVSDLPTGSKGQDMVLEIMRKVGKPRTMKSWIRRFYSWYKERGQIFKAEIEPLLRDGSVRAETHRVLFLFPVTRYSVSPTLRDRIVQRIRAELLERGPVDEDTAVLAMLLDSSKLLKSYFSSYEQEELRAKLKTLQEQQNERWRLIRSIRRAIDEMNAAVAASAAT